MIRILKSVKSIVSKLHAFKVYVYKFHVMQTLNDHNFETIDLTIFSVLIIFVENSISNKTVIQCFFFFFKSNMLVARYNRSGNLNIK